MDAVSRRRRSKGRWMRLKDTQLMGEYMKLKDFSQARLARYAGVSRQFIWQLLNDPVKRTCTKEVGERIEEALGVLPRTLFVSSESSKARPVVNPRKTIAPARQRRDAA